MLYLRRCLGRVGAIAVGLRVAVGALHLAGTLDLLRQGARLALLLVPLSPAGAGNTDCSQVYLLQATVSLQKHTAAMPVMSSSYWRGDANTKRAILFCMRTAFRQTPCFFECCAHR